MPFEFARKHIQPIRSKNKRASNTDTWWQYERPRPDMRLALEGKTRFIATPRVSKHRVFVWLQAEVLANDGTTVIARDDDYFLGMLHSRVHEVWALKQGTSLEDRPRYTPTTTFETFPFPWQPDKEPSKTSEVLSDDRARSADRSARRSGSASQPTKTSEVSLEHAIAAAARELVQLRDNWLNPPKASDAELKKRTLTNLYNERPTWLDNAHRKLDAAVFEAYGWPHDLSDEDILSRLLGLNLERAKNQE